MPFEFEKSDLEKWATQKQNLLRPAFYQILLLQNEKLHPLFHFAAARVLDRAWFFGALP